ncbi:fibronectin type III domain-containing protein [candidate division KSB1 bacterium]|nr:fibronectin type III domain-containing protein [candidate division KSB1 bacterium]
MKTLSVGLLLLLCCKSVETPLPDYGDVELSVLELSSTFVLLNWANSQSGSSLFYRQEGERHWQSCDQIFERPYSLIFLEPDTRYQIRVRIDERPHRLSPVLTVKTAPEQEKSWQNRRISTEFPLPSFIQGSLYPAIEVYGDKLYSVEVLTDEQRGVMEGLYLSIYDRSYRLLEQKRLVEYTTSYIGIQDATVHQDKLYITWNDIELSKAYYRMGIGVYDLTTQTFEILVRSTGAQADARAWEGGIESWRDRLWVVSLDQYDDPNGGLYKWKTQIVLREFDPIRRAFGDSVFVYNNSGSDFAYGPSLSVFEDELIILYSDLQPYSRSGEDYEPLYAVFFDGRQFHDRLLINDRVRNRYAKGVQAGDRFWLVYKSNMNYPGTAYWYHDIALSTIDLRDKSVQTRALFQDRKYNSSPDLAVWGDDLIAAYNKIEHLYTNEEDPARRYGCFVVEIRPEK